jgi:Flp pilus assembly pilin Flp
MQQTNDSATLVSEVLRDQSGAAAVEFGIIVMALFMAIIPAIIYVSTGLAAKLQTVTNYFDSLI